ncbi:MAG: pyridoxal phosphate-dependent aminotransferase [Promethearchaeota archaeon]|nr:MAG: pyridoxal phosphate-dependent aminotransferase [Candidatus Lokiarchaeota archaeon]
MVRSIASRIRAIPPSGIRRLFDLAQGVEGIISLGIGDPVPAFDTPEFIKEAAKKALDAGYSAYSPNLGFLELRELISTKYKQEYGLDYTVDEICVTCGAGEALYLACQALLDPGDEVIIPDPSFLTYPPQVSFAGGVPIPVPVYEENEFAITVEDIQENLTPKTKMIILNFPSNPTGAVMQASDLKGIADLALDHDLFILSDECYEKLVYDDAKNTCMASLGVQDRTIVVNSFSKTFSMTGWRVGYALANKEIINAMMIIHQMNAVAANSAAQMGCIAGMKNEGALEQFLNTMLTEFDSRRKLLVNGLNFIEGIHCLMPKGAFYAFPNIKGTGMTSAEFSEFMITQAKIVMVPGNVFGAHGEGYVRASFVASSEQIKEALERIKACARNIK